MKLAQNVWTSDHGWSGGLGKDLGDAADIVFLFGGTEVLRQAKGLSDLRSAYPRARMFGCSTAGEICGTRVHDDSLVATALHLEATTVQFSQVSMGEVAGSFEAGERLAKSLEKKGLVHVFALSDGQKVNGSDLVRGLLGNLPPGVQVTGGLAGDGARFERTLVFAENGPREGLVAVVGFYGDRIRVGYGSLGGWDAFGPERVVTRSDGNVLFELDGKPALDLYKTYLGEHATGLPATGLLFPLRIRRKDGAADLVRTILSVDEKAQSMVFAGDVPQGATAQLMKANFERLIDGASGAARLSHESMRGASPDLAILISCVGRKLVLKQRTEEEVEGVREVLGPRTVLTGFYSYGEICPSAPNASCELHNQTMTVTTLAELG
jgi:hypothetical protein